MNNPSSEAGLPSMEEIGMGDLAWGLAKRAIVEKWSDAELGPAIAKFARLWHAEQAVALAKEARDAPRRLPSLMLEWQRVAHSSGWPEEAKRLIDDMLSALLAFVDPHVEIDGKWVREAEARDAGPRNATSCVVGIAIEPQHAPPGQPEIVKDCPGYQCLCCNRPSIYALQMRYVLSPLCNSCIKALREELAARDAAKETGDGK